MKTNIYFEFDGKKVLASELEKTLKENLKNSGIVMKDIKEANLYFNSDENKCYYTLDDDKQGSFDL